MTLDLGRLVPPAGSPEDGSATEGPATDGSAPTAPDRQSRRTLRRWWWPASVGLALVLVTVLAAVVNRPPSTLPLAPDNPRPTGARAAAEILRDQGVRIAFRRTVAGAVTATPAEATILVTDPVLLTAEHWAALEDTGADLVLTDVALADLAPVTDAVETTGEGSDGVREAACDDPDARAAGRLSTGSGDVRARDADVTVCFPPPDAPLADGGARFGAYAVVSEPDRDIRVLANSRPLTNAGLAEAGNAALVLRILGRDAHLTWLVPSPNDPGGTVGSVWPPGTVAVAAWGALVVACAALWRGRRLGRLVAEPLPVVVPPAETTLGRARLYRRARAHRHAASALRAGTASRLAHRVGVPDSADPPALVAGVARATGRDPADVGALLYGPAPDDDQGLLGLARALDALESEVLP